MQLGQVVDYCIAFNNRHKDETPDPNQKRNDRKKKKGPRKYRKATQEEIKAYFG